MHETDVLFQNFLSPGELDPLNRRLVAEPKPDLVVQGWLMDSNFLASAVM